MKLGQRLGLIRIQLGGKIKPVGWAMTPDETQTFIKGLGKTVVTFFGYSSSYEDQNAMLEIAQTVLSKYSPLSTLINCGATRQGIGAIYPLAKSMGFTTSGIVSTVALEHPNNISNDVDHVCFIADDQWGGNLPGSKKLSPTSEAMVKCSDILIGIGGGEISRDEMIAGKEQGKPVHFYAAEISHAESIRRAQKMNLPPPESFWGAAHEIFGIK